MTSGRQVALLFFGAYLVGGVPFGLLVARLRGIDIRRHGSGNVGATNVGRVLGRPWGILVFVLDVAKGAACTASVGFIMPDSTSTWTAHRDLIWLGAGLACVLGNVAPVYLKFRGGKGVAASLGALFGIYPFLTWPGLAALLIWGLVVKATGYVSLGSILAASLLPLLFSALCWRMGWGLAEHFPLLGLCIGMAILVLMRHWENIGRLLAGTENKVPRRQQGSGER